MEKSSYELNGYSPPRRNFFFSRVNYIKGERQMNIEINNLDVFKLKTVKHTYMTLCSILSLICQGF